MHAHWHTHIRYLYQNISQRYSFHLQRWTVFYLQVHAENGTASGNRSVLLRIQKKEATHQSEILKFHI